METLKALAVVIIMLAVIVLGTLGFRRLQQRRLALQKNKNHKDSCCS